MSITYGVGAAVEEQEGGDGVCLWAACNPEITLTATQFILAVTSVEECSATATKFCPAISLTEDKQRVSTTTTTDRHTGTSHIPSLSHLHTIAIPGTAPKPSRCRLRWKRWVLEVKDQLAIMLLTEIPQIKEIESEVRLTVLYTDRTRENLDENSTWRP